MSYHTLGEPLLSSMVAVTGATGLVGTRLCSSLQSEGYSLIQLSRCGGEDVTPTGFIDGNTDWRSLVTGAKVVIHLAARVHVTNEADERSYAAFRRVNVEGTHKLALDAVNAGVRRLVFVSSVKVNGEATADNRPFRAADVPSPKDPYGRSKWEAEGALHAVARETGLEVVIVRPPLVYGPGVKANFARLMDLVAGGVPLPFAWVDNRRSLVAVDNLVDLLIRCATAGEAVGGTFMVSDGEDLSTPELIREISKALGRPTRLFPCPLSVLSRLGRTIGRSGEIERLCGSLQVDISETQQLLNWHPPVTVQEGIRRAVAGRNVRSGKVSKQCSG